MMEKIQKDVKARLDQEMLQRKILNLKNMKMVNIDLFYLSTSSMNDLRWKENATQTVNNYNNPYNLYIQYEEKIKIG